MQPNFIENTLEFRSLLDFATNIFESKAVTQDGSASYSLSTLKLFVEYVSYVNSGQSFQEWVSQNTLHHGRCKTFLSSLTEYSHKLEILFPHLEGLDIFKSSSKFPPQSRFYVYLIRSRGET